MDDETTKTIEKLQSELDDLKQKRVSQMNVLPASIKQRALVASTEMANGDMFYGDGANNFERIPTGTSGQALTVSSDGTPSWSTLDVPTKATSADIDTGTNDTNFATALAIAGSTLMKFSYTRFKVGSLTRAQDAADGAVATTGVGFQPKAIVFFWGVDGVAGGGTGFSDGTNHFASSTATNNTQRVQTTYVIETLDNSSWDEKGALTALGSDGFTLTWTKGGSPPSATIEIGYLAFR